MERRLSRTEEAAPEAIGGEEAIRIKVPNKGRKEDEGISPLSKWL